MNMFGELWCYSTIKIRLWFYWMLLLNLRGHEIAVTRRLLYVVVPTNTLMCICKNTKSSWKPAVGHKKCMLGPCAIAGWTALSRPPHTHSMFVFWIHSREYNMVRSRPSLNGNVMRNKCSILGSRKPPSIPVRAQIHSLNNAVALLSDSISQHINK